MRQLSESELNTISNGMQAAAARYREHAQTLRTLNEGAEAARENLAKQFEQQAKDAEAIAKLFGNLPEVVIGTCEKCAEGTAFHAKCPDRQLNSILR
jgi:hypothetical protein